MAVDGICGFAVAESGRNSVRKRADDMSELTRDGTVEPISRDQILRRERGQGNKYFFLFS